MSSETLENRQLLSATLGDLDGEAAAQAAPAAETTAEQVLVVLNSGEGAASFIAAANAQSVEVLSDRLGILLVTPSAGISVSQAVQEFGQLSGVKHAEPDGQLGVDAVPNDPMFGNQWALNNTGQTGGVDDADIDAPQAWEWTVGTPNVVVAVIDTGVDYTHEDLRDNIWVNPGEIPNNGIDDDSNGFVDDVHGFDFYSNDSEPNDDHGHGTHVAGTIAANSDNGVGVAGVAPNVTIMPLRFLGPSGSGSTSNAIRAIDYAVTNGAQISNNSWGGGGFSQALFDTIQAAGDAGHTFVAAAGNSARDADASPMYPAAYPLDNIISVAATDHRDNLAWFSNYGATTVDIAAPGQSILSTTPNNQYQQMSGTSMAAPHVAGTAALLLSQNPSWTDQEVKSRLLTTASPIDALAGKVVSGGRLNADTAVRVDDDQPTGGITGTSYHDINGDGQQSSDEPGLVGWTVYIDSNNSVEFDTGEPVSVTDTDGNYEFSELADGTYTVRSIVQPGWSQTSPVDAGVRLLAGTGSNSHNSFSLVELQTDPVNEHLIGPASYNPGLDVDPTTGLLYGASSSLRQIDQETGSYTTIGRIHNDSESSILMRSIAFSPDGQLFGVATGSGILHRIDKATGYATSVGEIADFTWGIDFAPDGSLFTGYSTLRKLDPNTGAVIETIGSLDRSVVDIDYAPDGYIYGVYHQNSTLYRIDPSDASMEAVGVYQSSTWGVASASIGTSDGGHQVTITGGETVSGADFGNQPDGSGLMQVSVEFTDADGNAIQDIELGQEFRINVYAQDMRAAGDPRGVLSAFADLEYDTGLIDVGSIVHMYDDFKTGTVDDANGLVDDAGGLEFSAPDNTEPQLVYYVTATATQPGMLQVGTNSGDGSFAENTLRGVDSDVREQTLYSGGSIQVSGHLQVSIDRPIREDAGEDAATGTVTRGTWNIDQPLVVTLGSSDDSEAVVPTTVTIPAGQTTATFAIDAVDDRLLDGTQRVTITAGADGYRDGANPLDVADYEYVHIQFNRTRIAENDGAGATDVTVVRSNIDDVSEPLTVTITNSDESELSAPVSVTIPAGSTGRGILVDAVDDNLLDGLQRVTLSTSAAGYYSRSAIAEVADHEYLTVEFSVDAFSEAAGANAATATISRSNIDDLAQPLTVDLANSDLSEASMPNSVVIPAGQSSAAIQVDAVDDNILDGTQTVTLTASAGGYEDGFDTVDVLDRELAELVAVSFDVESDHLLGGETAITFKIRNDGTGPANGLEIEVYHSDDSIIDAGDRVETRWDGLNLAPGETKTITSNVALSRSVLYQRSLLEDAVNPVPGTRSSSTEYLGLWLDPNNTIEETDESNNVNQGLGVDSDDATYFPWDVNGNGSVTPVDVAFMSNRIGQSDDQADLDGDGVVTPAEVVATINRVGYLRNDAVYDSANSNSLAGLDLETGAAGLAAPQAQPRGASILNVENADQPLMSMSVDVFDSNGNPVDQVAVGDTIRIQVVATDLRNDGNGVHSAFADLLFDETRINVSNVSYGFDDFTSGDMGAGRMSNAGGFSIDVPGVAQPQSVMTIEGQVLSTGPLSFELAAADGPLAQNLLAGMDQDVSARTRFGRTSLDVTTPETDSITELFLSGTGRRTDFVDVQSHMGVQPSIELRSADGELLSRGLNGRVSLAGYPAGEYQLWVDESPENYSLSHREEFGTALGAADTSAIDLDGNGDFQFATDGVLLLSFALGARGSSLEPFRASGDARTGAEIETAIGQLSDSLDLDGSGEFTFATDGIMLLAYMLGLRGHQLEAFGATDATRSGSEIDGRISGLTERTIERRQTPESSSFEIATVIPDTLGVTTLVVKQPPTERVIPSASETGLQFQVVGNDSDAPERSTRPFGDEIHDRDTTADLVFAEPDSIHAILNSPAV